MSMAAEAFEIKIEKSARRRRGLGWLVTISTGLLSLGEPWIKNPGGRRFIVRDSQSGRVIATIEEPIGDDEGATLAALRVDLDRMNRDEFAETWCC